MNYYERNKFDYAGGSGGYMDVLCYPFARGRLFLEQEIDNKQYDDDTQCFWASGTAIMVRKKYFLEVEKFDENFINSLKSNMPDIVYIYSQNSASGFLKFIKITNKTIPSSSASYICVGCLGKLSI